MKTLSHRKFKLFAQFHTISKWWNYVSDLQSLIPGLSPCMLLYSPPYVWGAVLTYPYSAGHKGRTTETITPGRSTALPSMISCSLMGRCQIILLNMSVSWLSHTYSFMGMVLSAAHGAHSFLFLCPDTGQKYAVV